MHTERSRDHFVAGISKNKCRKRDIDASDLCVKDILDIPGLMDILDVYSRVAGLTYILELLDRHTFQSLPPLKTKKKSKIMILAQFY